MVCNSVSMFLISFKNLGIYFVSFSVFRRMSFVIFSFGLPALAELVEWIEVSSTWASARITAKVINPTSLAMTLATTRMLPHLFH